jgi:polysaccharide biosynthesis/export protein ExoF
MVASHVRKALTRAEPVPHSSEARKRQDGWQFMRKHLHWVQGPLGRGYLLLCSLALCTATFDVVFAQTIGGGAVSTPVGIAQEPEIFQAAEPLSATDETYTAQPTGAEPQPTGAGPTANGVSAPTSAAGERDAYPIGPGDRLKVLVYDRPDITAEYRVSDQGEIRIPTLGTFDAAKRSAPQLEQSIAEMLERLLQRPAIVTVEIVERRPIFVTGLVAKPGAYRFTAGMAVIHATALAGGTSASASSILLPTEALREGSHARTSEEELKRLLATQARLTAERDGSSEITTPPLLAQLAGPERAADRIRDERENMGHRQEIHDRQAALLRSSIEEGKTEVAAYQKELAKIQEQRSIRETTLETLETLSKRGLTTQQRLTDSQFLLVTADRDAQTAIANIARSQQNLEKAERDLAMLALGRKLAIAKELQDINDRIVNAKLSIDGSKKVISHIAGISPELLGRGETQFRYEIVSKGSDGELHTTAATEMTKLQPGDVVRISSPEQSRYSASDTLN